MAHQIMGEGTLLGDLTHEHRDRAADRLIDVNDEHLVIIPDKNRAPATGRQYCPHLHLDHRFAHHGERYPHRHEKQALRCLRRIDLIREIGHKISSHQVKRKFSENFGSGGLHVWRPD
jgi:hypothetical protein